MGEPHATHSAVPQPFHPCGGAYSFGGLVEWHPFSLPSLHGREWPVFAGNDPPSEKGDSKSAVDIKHGNSDVVIGYQVDEFYSHLVSRVLHCLITLLSWFDS